MSVAGFDTTVFLTRVLAGVLRSSSTAGLTLDLLRSDLAHESSAKLARLVAIVSEWEKGRYRPDDPRDVRRILDDLEAILARHARLTLASLRCFGWLLKVLSSIHALRATVRPVMRGQALSDASLRRMTDDLERFRRQGSELAAALSNRYGARVDEIVARAANDVRREIGGGLTPGSVTIVVDSGDGHHGAWVPRAEAQTWLDLLRNLVRNAVEATQEKRAASAEAGRQPRGDPPAVIMRLRPAVRGSGTALEIVDQGIGMTADEVERIWTTGGGRHGSGRGQGLTESKRAFLLARSPMEIRSQPGIGTVFRIDFPVREIGIPRLPLYRLQVVYVPLTILAVGLTVLLARPRQFEFQTVRMVDATTVEASDRNGRPVWTRNLGETVLTNDPAGTLATTGRLNISKGPLVIRRGNRGERGVLLATQALNGPGRLWFVGRRTSWSHTLRWHVPVQRHLGSLVSVWQRLVPWDDGEESVLALCVQDGTYSATSVQFFTTGFDSLGAYYHDGHLWYRAADDFDGDGRTEVLLFGVNNPAMDDPSVVPRRQEAYLDCLALLEIPAVSGQAYPSKEWPGMPPAAEEGYLIVTPLRDGIRPLIRRIDLADPRSGDASPIEVWIADGRIYHLDGRLRPLSCTTRDFTPARELAPTRPIAPLVYFSRGEREAIDLVVH